MAWTSLSAFYMRGVQGICELPSEGNYGDSGFVPTLTSQPQVQYNHTELPFQPGVSELDLANDLSE